MREENLNLAILCVDDDPLVLSALTEELKVSLGTEYHVITAKTGEEALTLLNGLKHKNIVVPLAIVDYDVSGLLGDELLVEIQRIMPQTIKIMMVGQTSGSIVGNAVNRTNLYRCVSKSWKSEELQDTVQQALLFYDDQKHLLETEDDSEAKGKVLIVDDSKSIRYMVREHLEEDQSYHFDVCEAVDGQDAYDFLKSCDRSSLPDLILLDRNMPKMSGDELIQTLKKSEKFKHIPILFMTDLGKAEAIVEGLSELHADDYLVKPFDLRVMKARSKSLIRIKHAEDQNKKLHQALWQNNKELEVKVHQRTLELKKAKEEAEQARIEAENANQAKSAFLANMSHEIRTPLNSIAGFSELLAPLLSDPKETAYVEEIKSAGNNLLTLINDILDLSRIEAGMMEVVLKPESLAELLGEIEKIFKAKVKEKSLHFSVELDPRLPSSLIMDKVMLRQVLLNLVGNAVKFTEKGFVKISAKGNGSPEGEGWMDVTFSVSDSGIGIPQAGIQKIFASFQQYEDKNDRKYGGTGLGLALGKRLTELMGGSIHVQSQPEQGSTFEVHIPKVKVPFVDEGEEENPSFAKLEKVIADPMLSDEAKNRLPLVIVTLELEFLPWTKLAEEVLPMKEVRQIGESLKEIGRQNDIPQLMAFGQIILEQVECFDIIAIQQKLKEFPQLIEKLKAILK